MTQDKAGFFTPGRIILLAAALALGFAVAFALRHGKPAELAVAPPTAAASAFPSGIDALEGKAKASPSDVSAWRQLGASYFDAGRYADAIGAYQRAADIDGSQASIWSALGEARVMASKHEPLPAEAVADFIRAVGLDHKDPRARYFLAVKKDIEGDHQGAIADWLTLLGDTPPGAPWEEDLRRTIEQVGKIHKIEVAGRMAAVKQPAPLPNAAAAPAGMPLAAQGIPGPSEADLRAASQIPPSQQRQMADGMVARLESKLQADPANPEGWIMLMRSRMTLGEPDKASAALAAAVKANPGDAARLRQEASVLGVK